jgi:hypothetical protein
MDPGLGKSRKSGTARPRWIWSGAAIRPDLSKQTDQVSKAAALLPSHHSTNDQIVMSLLQLGSRYHRYVQQDELGPTRVEQTAALRSLLDQLDALETRLEGLPQPLRLQLSENLEQCDGLTCAPSALYESHLVDQTALECLWEAANDVGRIATDAGAIGHAQLLLDLATAAEKSRLFLLSLDTTTEGEVVLDTGIIHPGVLDLKTNGDDALSLLCAQIRRLHSRLQLTLDRLASRKGPEKQLSLTWLVWELCDLWSRETGQPVTSSAVQGGNHTGKPQSAAGRFILNAAEALHLPNGAQNQRGSKLPVRGQTIGVAGNRAQIIHYSMRKYVAHQPPSPHRPGRRKTLKATL